MSQEQLTSIINDLQSTIHNQTTIREKHEIEIQQLDESNQRIEVDVHKLATEFSETKRSIEICTQKIEACRKEKEILQEKAIDEQEQLDVLTQQFLRIECTYDIKFKEVDGQLAKQDAQLKKQDKHIAKQDEQMAKQDEHITKQDKQIENQGEQMTKQDEIMATCLQNINDIRKTQLCTHNSSEGRKRKKLEDDTKSLIEEDLREDTFVTTKAVTESLSLLQKNGVLLITGCAGTGKSRIARHVLYMYYTGDTSYRCIKLNTLDEWENMVSREDNVVVLLDDIFGETNCVYNREKDIPILDKVHAYVWKGNIKVIITIRDTVKRRCQEVFDSHRLFQFGCIDLSSKKYNLSWEEKFTVLDKYMNIVRQSHFVGKEGFVNSNNVTILKKDTILKITNGSPVKGFPLAVYQFVNNAKYFKLGSNFFDRPTDAMLEELNEIRRKGNDNRKYKMQYTVMVYTAINENFIDPQDGSIVREVKELVEAIYGESLKTNKCHISDAVDDLKGSYLVNTPYEKSYRFHHQTLLESVILSFAQIDDEHIKDIVPLLNWSFIQKMVKPDTYKEREGEVVLKIPFTSYEILAFKLVDIYKAAFSDQIDISQDTVLDGIINTEIFQQEFDLIFRYLLKAVEEEDNKYEDNKYLYECISSEISTIESVEHMKSTPVFLCNLLMSVAKTEGQFEKYYSILQMLNQIFKKSNDFRTIDYIKGTFVTSLYDICSTKDVRCVKATLNVLKENKIPVFLDQAISLKVINYQSHFLCSNYTNCAFLTFCIWKSYEVLNVPVLEYLLALYNETRFDLNLFFKFIYGTDLMETCSFLSHKPLKWMIERFEDQKLVKLDNILRKACQYHLFDTVEYLASRCKAFDAVSCLKIFLHYSDDNDAEEQNDYFDFDSNLFFFLFSKIDKAHPEIHSIVISVLQKPDVPDYVCETLLPVCTNNGELLNIACAEGLFYITKLILEKSQNVSIQSALISACMNKHDFALRNDVGKLEIVKYIIDKYGCEQFDLKAVCEQAYHCRKFNIIEWFVQNIDINLLDENCIINLALESEESDLVECIMLQKIEIASLDKTKVFKSLTEHCTARNSSKILEIVSSVWDSTENKIDINMDEIIETAYQGKCLELLIWIHTNCYPHVAIDAEKLFITACVSERIDIAKWVLETFEQIPLNINAEKLLMLPNFTSCPMYNHFIKFETIDRIHWVLETFEIQPFHLKEFVIKLISINHYVQWNTKDAFFDLIISLIEKYGSLFSSEDMEEIMNEALENKYFNIVNWFLEYKTSCTFDKQNILNKACGSHDALATIMILTKSCHILDINQAFIQACIHDKSHNCQSLFEQMGRDSLDTGTIVSLVRDENVTDTIMTWILNNLAHDPIIVNEIFISSCQKGKFYFVKYIFQKYANEQLDIESAFVDACLNPYNYERDQTENLCVIDFLFRKLPDQLPSISIVINGLLEKKDLDVLLYFLKKGYRRKFKIDMKYFLNEVCSYGHFKLVHWILENVDHTELDIKSAFYNACTTKDVCWCTELKLHCVFLLKHYIQDIYVLEVDTVLKCINETPSDFPHQFVDDLTKWLLYIKCLRGKDI
ncbi:uncharacterized protein [Mytilus edulis]|uniref:uncharacterized protein n=1 Tax=Mytilus edulis TaxID=6550 RepID=UPI0039EDFCFA